MEGAVRGGADGPCRCGQSVGMMCRRKKKRISDVFDASGPRRSINGRREGWRNHPEKPFQTPGGGPQYSSGEPPHIFFFRSLHESPVRVRVTLPSSSQPNPTPLPPIFHPTSSSTRSSSLLSLSSSLRPGPPASPPPWTIPLPPSMPPRSPFPYPRPRAPAPTWRVTAHPPKPPPLNTPEPPSSPRMRGPPPPPSPAWTPCPPRRPPGARRSPPRAWRQRRSPVRQGGRG